MRKPLCFGVLLGIAASSFGWYGADAKKVQCDGVKWIYDVKGNAAIVRHVESTNDVLRIPDTLGATTVRGIGHYAFERCLHLTEVYVPPSVENIEDGAFASRAKSMILIFEGDLPNIGQHTWGVRGKRWPNPLSGCQSVFVADGAKGCPTNSETCLDVPLFRYRRGASAPFYKFRDEKSGFTWSYIISNGSATLISVFPRPEGTMIMPSSLNGVSARKIGGMALMYSEKMMSAVIPASVTNIAEESFRSCGGLRFVLFEGDAPHVDRQAFGGSSYLRFYAFAGSKGWPADGFLHGHEVIRIPRGADFAAITAEECRYPYAVGECRSVGAVGRAALKAGCALPEFDFGPDYPVKVVQEEGRWPGRQECIELPVVVDRPFLDLGIHRVHIWRDNRPLRHLWIRNEVRYPVDRKTRIAEYEAIKAAIKERYGTLGTEIRRKAFFAEQWKTTFETDEIRIEVAVDPDGLCRPLTVVATDVERERDLKSGIDERRADCDGVDVFDDDVRCHMRKKPLVDFLKSMDNGSDCPSRWPFDGLPFGMHIDTLGWDRVKTDANGEVMAEESCDGLGLGFTTLSAHADKESGRIFRFVAAEDLSLADYSNICQMVSRHYGTKGVEDNEYREARPFDELWRGGVDSAVTVPIRLCTEFVLPHQIIRLRYFTNWMDSPRHGMHFCLEVDDVERFKALREEFRKRFENDRLEKFTFGEIRQDVSDSVLSRMISSRLAKPFRLFGREHVWVTPTTHRVWKRVWEGDVFPGWMTPADVSNELHYLEKELIRLYGGSPTQEWGRVELHAGGCTFEYGTGEAMSMELTGGFGDTKNRMVLSVSDDALAAACKAEEFIHGYEMDKFVFGRNPPNIRVGVGTKFDFESPVRYWSGRMETITNTDIVCRHVWTHEPSHFTAVGCCHLGDVGGRMLEASYRRSKIVIGNAYGVTNLQESVTTNGVVETSVARFRKEPVTVTLTMRREIAGKEKVRSLTIVGEMDEAPLRKSAEAK